MREQLHKVSEEDMTALLKNEDKEIVYIAKRLKKELVFLEKKMEEEKKQPFLDDEGRVTGAAQLYRVHVGEYVRILKALSVMVDRNKAKEEKDKEKTEETPLQAFMREQLKAGK